MYTDDAAQDFARRLDQIDLYLYPWVSAVQEEIDGELTHLKFLLSHENPHVRSDSVAQLQAIKVLLVSLFEKVKTLDVSVEEPIAKFERAQKLLLFIQDHIDDLYQHLKEAIDSIERVLKLHPSFNEASVSYGSDAYFALASRRPPMPKSGFSKGLELLDRYANPFGYLPEKWRPSREQIYAMLAIFVVIGQHVTKSVEKASLFSPSEDRLQFTNAQSPSSEVLRKIDKEVALIGTILSDKYSVLGSWQSVERLAKHYPQAVQRLEKVIAQYGTQTISQEEIRHILDVHREQRIAEQGNQ